MVVSVTASASGTPLSSPWSATARDRVSSVACRILSTAARTRFSRKMTTGSTTTSKITLPIHHKTMTGLLARGLVWKEEAPEDPAQRHQRGPHAQGEAPGRGAGGRGDLLGGLTPFDPLDPVLHV